MIRLPIRVGAFLLALAFSAQAHAQSCVNVLHDESDGGADKTGSINAIFLANLLGHWPEYEVRVKPIFDYQAGDADQCNATVYLGSSSDTEVPKTFLSDFFTTTKNIAWVGFGVQQLESNQFATTFGYRVAGALGLDKSKGKTPGFFQNVIYKGKTFAKTFYKEGNAFAGPFEAVNYVKLDESADGAAVLADLVHNKSNETKPYILRQQNKFLVADVPFSYIHEGDRYFVFADLLFDVLNEPAGRANSLAFVRLEDIHAFYEQDLLKATFETLRQNGVPISIAHIPVFADPFNAVGLGATKSPKSALEVDEFVRLVQELKQDDRNAIIWHGTTHQFGRQKNPWSGASGDDYEFWDAVRQRPIKGDSVNQVVDRLKLGLQVFDGYGVAPRYWVTPHYQASALDNAVFGRVFPWVVGRVTYYPSSVGSSFVLKPTTKDAAPAWPSVTEAGLDEVAAAPNSTPLDRNSRNGEGQLFPYEIYRDIYGQRVIPETLNYLSLSTEEGGTVRDVKDMLADAERNAVVRDYWASCFVHPYLFNTRENGGGGAFVGDTARLKDLIVGLKQLGFTFVGLPEFEEMSIAASKHAESGPR
jgi:uncharacterized protein YdaL